MYGILLESIICYIKKVYSEEKWQLIRKTARIEYESFSAHQVYAETIIPKIVDACHMHLGLPKEDILVAFGKHYIEFVSHYGYDNILKVIGRNFRDFLNGLDNIHEYLRFSYPKLKPPSFFCEQENRSGLILHYRSRRQYHGYTWYVIGQLKAIGKQLYNQDISVSIVKQSTTGNLVHVVYQLSFDNFAYQPEPVIENGENGLPEGLELFHDLFPFHILFDRESIIRSIGRSLRATTDELIGCDITQVFSLKKPLIDFNWEAIISHTNSMFELQTTDPIRFKKDLNKDDYWTDEYGKRRVSMIASMEDDKDTFLRLKGQMFFVKNSNLIMFLGTAVLQDLDCLLSSGLYLNDLSMHDNSRELVLAGAQQGVELKLILKQEQVRTKELDETLRKLEKEMQRNRDLMYKMLPKPLAVEFISHMESYENEMLLPDIMGVAQQATVFVCSISHLDELRIDGLESENIKKVISLHKQIELLAERYGFFKIETTHNSFMGIGGIPTAGDIVEENACLLAKKIARFASNLSLVALQIGIHSGPAIYAVIGCRCPRLCIFGPTVIIAQQLLDACKTGSEKINIVVSDNTKLHLAESNHDQFQSGPVLCYKESEIATHLLQF